MINVELIKVLCIRLRIISMQGWQRAEPARRASRAGQDEPSRAKDFKLASRASERVGSLAGPKSHPASQEPSERRGPLARLARGSLARLAIFCNIHFGLNSI